MAVEIMFKIQTINEAIDQARKCKDRAMIIKLINSRRQLRAALKWL